MGLGPPTPHENGLAYAGRGSGNVALSWYARVRNESDVGAFGTPHCRIRARRAESCTREAPPGRGQTSPGGSVMDQLIERCCGLDVHRDTVAACVRVPGPNGKQRHEVRPFGTTAVELLALRDWLEAHGVTHVAMESTGVYWKRWCTARRTPRCWPTWRGASCARSCRRCARRWLDASDRITRFWSASSWRTSITWMRRSPR